MRDVARWTQAGECAVVGAQAREQQHVRAHCFVVLVALARAARRARHRLALPVHQLSADRVVAVARGRREVAAGLVEREGQQIRARRFHVVHAALPRRHLRALADAERSPDLDARVLCMRAQRHVRCDASG